ncbi:MAG: hypothetical protein H6739_31335 [Alphaproteobacteria bacterium]|nr:hypothetical protein [Alphaproteobacteria bacterium]
MIAALALLCSAALAQSDDGSLSPAVSVDLFRPALDTTAGLATDSARPGARWGAQITGWWVKEPLVYVEGDEITAIVSGTTATALSAWWSFGRLRLGGTAPVYLYSTGDVAGLQGVALGDPGLDARVWLLSADRPLGLALIGRVTGPLGASERQLGQPGWAGEVGLAADLDREKFSAAVNVGTWIVPTVSLGELVLDDALWYRAAAGWTPTEPLWLGVELTGRSTYASFSTNTGHALEGRAVGRWTSAQGVGLFAGVGSGLTVGPGSPTARVVAGVSLTPARSQ